MKKILLATAFVMIMVCGANAQGRDSFFSDWDNGINNRTSTPGIDLPNAGGLVTGNEYGNDEPAPLGSGLLVLTALGAGYAVYRKRNK